MSGFNDFMDGMKHHEATDGDIEHLFNGSLEPTSDLAPLADLVASLRSEATTAVNEETIADYRRSSAIKAANTAQEFAFAQAESALSTQRATSASLVAASRRRVATTAAAATMFVGSLSGVAAAADHAKPGDALYGVDRALESIGIGNGNADERLAEVQALFDSGEVLRGLHHTADLLDTHGADNAAASTALLNAADHVMSGGSDQSAEVRDAVAGLLSRLSKETHEFNGLDVAELARRIGRPDNPSTEKPPVDPGPPDHSRAKTPDRPDFTPGSKKSTTGKP